MVVSVPETTVEYRGQPFVPRILLVIGKRTVQYALNGFLIALHHGQHVFWSSRASFYFKYPDTGIHHTVDETDGLQVLGRHDVFVVYLQFRAGLTVGDEIGPSAYLHAGTTVGRASGVVETHVALAADSHAQGSVAEHLDADLLAAGTADVLSLYLAVYLRHLFHVQFTGQHYDIGELCIEAQSLDVRDVQLGRQMHLYSHLSAVLHDCHIAGNDGSDAGLMSCIHNGVHQRDVFAVDDGVHRQVALHTGLPTDGSYLP